MGIIALLKVIGCRAKIFALEALAVILLLGATGTIFLQGKHGGEIVYNYGKPFQMEQLTNYLNNSDDLGFAKDADEAVKMVKDKAVSINTQTDAKLTISDEKPVAKADAGE